MPVFMQNYNAVKAHIREQEANFKVQPISMQWQDDDLGERWTFRFPKMVVYSNIEDQTKAHTFQAKDALNCELHAQTLKLELERFFGPGVTVAVEVTPRFKTLLGIPLKIPFSQMGIKAGPNKVRGRQNSFLATQATDIKLTLCGKSLPSLSPDHIWAGLNRSACLHNRNHLYHDSNGTPFTALIADDISARATRNPLRWIARGLSGLVPRSLAKYLPNFMRAPARLYPYGHPIATKVIDFPVVETGLAASAANAGIVGAGSALIFAGLMAACGAMQSSNSRSSHANHSGFLADIGQQPLLGHNLRTAAALISHNALHCHYASNHQSGMFFTKVEQDAVVVTKNPGCFEHMPFATRTVIRSK